MKITHRIYDKLLRVKKPFLMIRLYKNWLTALLDRFHLLTSKPVMYTLRNGTQLLVQAHALDVRVINEIWIDQIYIPKSDWQIQPDWVVMDLGAHKGIFSTFAARARKIIAIDANPETFRIYRDNIARNGLQEKVQAIHGIIANDEGEADFYLTDESVCCSSVQENSSPVQQKITVPKISINRLFTDIEKIDLLKMDIEGSEFDLLRSHDCKFWLEKVRRIAMEYHEHFPGFPYSVEELVIPLRKAGFQVHVQRECRTLWAEKVPA